MKKIKEKSFPEKNFKVSLRWNPSIGKGFNPRVITAGRKSINGTPVKFGIEERRVIPTYLKVVQYGFTSNFLFSLKSFCERFFPEGISDERYHSLF